MPTIRTNDKNQAVTTVTFELWPGESMTFESPRAPTLTGRHDGDSAFVTWFKPGTEIYTDGNTQTAAETVDEGR